MLFCLLLVCLCFFSPHARDEFFMQAFLVWIQCKLKLLHSIESASLLPVIQSGPDIASVLVLAFYRVYPKTKKNKSHCVYPSLCPASVLTTVLAFPSLMSDAFILNTTLFLNRKYKKLGKLDIYMSASPDWDFCGECSNSEVLQTTSDKTKIGEMGSFSETAGILFPGSAAILIGCGALVLFGMLWNVCNIVMIVPQLCQSKDRQCVDFIILCISVSNVLLDISAFGYLFINQFELHCHTELHTIIRIVFYVFFSATCLSFWSITWLCVFYCVKIVSFPMAFFVKLKRNIPSVINVALILTVVSCLILYIPFFFFSLPTHEENDTLNIKCPELSVHFSKPINRNLYLYTFLCFLCPIPLSFMLTTSISLVSHLCKHTRSMKKNETSFQSRNAYMLIVKMIISLVVVYLVTIIMAFICFIIQEKSTDLANHIIIPNMAFFCLATGVLLTITNKNLKEKFMAACCCKKTQTDPANLSERLN